MWRGAFLYNYFIILFNSILTSNRNRLVTHILQLTCEQRILSLVLRLHPYSLFELRTNTNIEVK